MAQDENNGRREGQGQVQGEKQPKEGDKVSWNWGAGHPQGTVTETAVSGEIPIETKRGNTVKKNADEQNPALLISRPGAGQQDVVKRASEVEVNTAEGEGTKDADSTSASASGTNSRKRKEQASTPTKKQATKGHAENEKNSAKKVRTGKEDDTFGSDIDSEDDNGDNKEVNEDKDTVLPDADPVVDPDETEDEKDKPAGKAGEVTKEEAQDKKKEDATTKNDTTGVEKKAEPEVVRKSHEQSKSSGEKLSSSGGNNTKSKSNDGPSEGEKENQEGNEKARRASTSAASGKNGGNSSAGENTNKPEEGKEFTPTRRSSINEILNQETNKTRDTDKMQAPLPPRQAKEVAEEKIAEASGTTNHGSGVRESGGKPAEVAAAAGKGGDNDGK